MEGYIGEIRLFAGTFAPVNWEFCDGSTKPISSYDAAFTILGTTYGGDGMTTFGLPDLRGRVPVHPGQGMGLNNVEIGQAGGEENHTLTVDEIPRHGHGTVLMIPENTSLMRVSSKAGSKATGTNGKAAIAIRKNNDSINTFINQDPNIVINSGNANATVPNSIAGNSLPHQNMQQYQALNYIICLVGIFPSQP
jgi:microcystin-dependent protein